MSSGYLKDEERICKLLKKMNQLSKTSLQIDQIELNLTNSVESIEKIKDPLFQLERDIMKAIRNRIDSNIFMDLEVELKDLLQSNF